MTATRAERALRSLLAVTAALTGAIPACASAEKWTVEQVVMLMRHGVRPPLHEPAVPSEIAPDPWPKWQVPAGWLTEHGGAAIGLLGAADARWFTQQGLLPGNGCPEPGTVEMVSDSDERTIATGDAYLAALAPNCGIQNQHHAQGVADPLFDEYPRAGLSAAAAQRAIDGALGSGGIAGAQRQVQPLLDIVSRIVCGDRNADCGPSAVPSGVRVEPSGQARPKLTGGLDYAATIAQAVLLEYADGRPMAQVGWGRASADDIRAIGALHSLELSIIARPRPLAVANAGQIVRKMLDALRARTPLALVVGHDTEIANVGGILDVHWSVAGYADDDPAPGGALGFEVVRDQAGNRFVRTFYRAQTLDHVRSLNGEPAVRVDLVVPGCHRQTSCPIDEFTVLLESSLG